MGVEVVPPSALNRDHGQIATTALGLVAQNYPREVTGSSSIMVGGTAYAMLLGLRAGDVIANGYVHVVTAAASPTLFKFGVYSADGTTLLASTADKSSTISTTTGVKTLALQAAWTVPADAGYYAVIVATAGTLPTLVRGAAFGSETVIGSNPRPFATGGTALSDLPAVTVTWTASNSPIGYWVGLG